MILRYTHSPAYGNLAFSADGKRLAITSMDHPHVFVDLLDLGGELPKRIKRRRVSAVDLYFGIALLPDGKQVAVGDVIGGLAIYDLDGPEETPSTVLQTPGKSRADVYNVMVSSDGKRIGAIFRGPEDSNPDECSVRFWDISAAKPTEVYSIPIKLKKGTFSGSLSALLAPDSKTLFVAGGTENWLEAYDLTGARPKLLDRSQDDHPYTATLVRFSKGAGAAELLRRDLELWHVANGKLKKAKELPKDTVAATDDLSRVVIAGDRENNRAFEMFLCDTTGKELVKGSVPTVYTSPFIANGRVHTTTWPYQSWEVKDGAWRVAQQWERDPYRTGFLISPDEKLVAAQADQQVLVFPPQDLFAPLSEKALNEMVAVPAKGNGYPAYCWGADSKTLFIAQLSGAIEAWDVTQRPAKSRPIWKGIGPYSQLIASVDGTHLACLDAKRKLFLIDLTGKTPPTVMAFPETVQYFSFAQFTFDGSALLAADFNATRIYRYPVGQPQAKPSVVLERLTGAGPFAVSRDGKFLVRADGNTLRWYDATATPMRPVGEWKTFTGAWTFQIAPDSRHVLLEQAGMIYVLRIGGNAEIAAAPPWHPIPVGESPFEKLDAAKIPAAERFDWQPKELVAVLGEHRQRHFGSIQAITCTPDGATVASMAPDGVRIWDGRTMEQKAWIRDVYTSLAPMLLGPGGKRLLAARGSSDSWSCWDLTAAEPRILWSLSPEQALAFCGGGRSTADGATVMSADANSKLRLWDVTDNGLTQRCELKESTTPPQLLHNIGLCAFSPDGKWLAVGGPDGSVPLATEA